MPISTSIRFAAIILICTLCIVLGVTNAAADKRVALVIGNGAYQNVAKLANPTNDAAAIAAMLKNANFDEVRIYHDLGIRELRRAIAEFAHVARVADMALVFHSGQGIEVDGVNYLIPIDAVLEEDIDISYETFSLDNLVNAAGIAPVAIEPRPHLQ